MKKRNAYIVPLIRPLLISLAVFLVLLLSFSHFLGVGSSVKRVKTDGLWSIELIDSNGNVTKTDGPYFNQIHKGDTMRAVMIPQGSLYPRQAALSFVLYHSVVNVSVDGKTIYQQEAPEVGKQVGGRAYLISLPQDYVGKEIAVTAQIVENDGISNFSDVNIAQDTMAIYALESGKTFRFLIFGSMLIVSLFMTLFYFVDGFAHHESIYSGMLSLSCGMIILWYLGYCNLLYVFSDHWDFAANCEYPALFLAPIPLAFHMAHVIHAEPWKRLEKILSIVSIVFFAIVTILSISPSAWNYTDFVVDLHLDAGLILVISAIGLFIDSRHESASYKHVLAYGLILSILLAVIELARFNLNLHYGSRFPFLHVELAPFALLSLLTTLLLSTGVRAGEDSVQRIEEESLRRLAYVDPLTSLANRASLHRTFDEMRAQKKMDYVLFFLDLNNLKVTNDTYGHEMGDELIKEIASILQKEIGEKGFAGRWGGDEFVAGIYGTKDEALACMDQMKMEADRINQSKRHPFVISASYGMCVSTADNPVDPKDAMHIADEEMYSKKMKYHLGRE